MNYSSSYIRKTNTELKMKKTVFTLALVAISFWASAQNKEEAEKLVGEGVEYHDKGDYVAAIGRYSKALEFDKDNALALTEMAFTLNAKGDYQEAIKFCEKVFEVYPGDKAPATAYVIYGTAFDNLKQPDKSIEAYNKGIKAYPNDYMLYFNKGITMSAANRLDGAMLCFQKALTLNPTHAGSHNAIATIAYTQKNNIPALLACCRFLVIEPQGNRAKRNLDLLEKTTEANVEKTGKKSVNIYVDANMLNDTTATGKKKEDNFTSTQMVLSMSTALDYSKEFKNQNNIEKLIRKLSIVCSSLHETKDQNHGFFWEYYVPYFLEMKEKNHLETFAYIAYASANNADADKWLKAHDKEIKSFYEWSGNFNWKKD